MSLARVERITGFNCRIASPCCQEEGVPAIVHRVGNGMKTICVAGSASRAGKTAFSTRLLARLAGWSACKVTTCVPEADGSCARGRGEECGVCGRLRRPYEIDEERGAGAADGRDTERLRAAGASRVLWVRTRPEALSQSIRAALETLDGSPGVLLEGNHVLEVLDPDVAVMVLAPGGSLKKSARDVRDRVDIFANGFEDQEALERVLRGVLP
jgi:hypothetical protein